jgi:hypothetical protein
LTEWGLAWYTVQVGRDTYAKRESVWGGLG